MEAQRHRRAVSEYHGGNRREEQIPRYPEFPHTLNIIILFPRCQLIYRISSNWSTACALQVCQGRQSSARASCAVPAIAWTHSSSPKDFYNLGWCLLLYQLCQQLIRAWQSPAYSKILMTCRIMAQESKLIINSWQFLLTSPHRLIYLLAHDHGCHWFTYET